MSRTLEDIKRAFLNIFGNNEEIFKDYHYNENEIIYKVNIDKKYDVMDYHGIPLTFQIITGGTLYWRNTSNIYDGTEWKTIRYKKNDGEWIPVLASNEGNGTIICEVESGDIVEFEGNNPYYSISERHHHFVSSSGCTFNVYGNIISLTNYSQAFSEQRTFEGLFSSNKGIIDASNLILPSGQLTKYCFHWFFYNCSNLTKAPKLTSINLEESCYSYMFAGCSNLNKAPQLPALIMKPYCYWHMFQGCTGLTKPPVLPATTLSNYCYSYMFSGCSNLTETPNLPVMTLSPACYHYMFENCSNLSKAYLLPALILQNDCYRHMFWNCSKLNKIECLATNISASNCLDNWVRGVASTGIFIKDANTSWSTGNSGIPSNWTIQNA